MMSVFKNGIFIFTLTLYACLAHAQFADEDVSESGVTNPSDFSWRYYEEALNRFPERVGITCYNAYILDKTGSYTEETLMFLKACADHGNVAVMIYIASLYENDNRIPLDYKESAKWLKRAAETHDEAGYSNLAAYHYAVALLKGLGVTRNAAEACRYLEQAKHGEIEEAEPLMVKEKC